MFTDSGTEAGCKRIVSSILSLNYCSMTKLRTITLKIHILVSHFSIHSYYISLYDMPVLVHS